MRLANHPVLALLSLLNIFLRTTAQSVSNQDVTWESPTDVNTADSGLSITNETATTAEVPLANQQLHFQSSSQTITINNTHIYATLLPAKQLHAILTHARQDLTTQYDQSD